MTRVQRIVHAWLWVVLGPVVLAGVIVAVWSRPGTSQGAKSQAAETAQVGGER